MSKKVFSPVLSDDRSDKLPVNDSWPDRFPVKSVRCPPVSASIVADRKSVGANVAERL